MLKRNTELIKDEEIRLAIKFIQEEALGKIIELSAVPVPTVPLLEDDTIGRYLNIIYIRKGMKVYVVTPSSVITIT